VLLSPAARAAMRPVIEAHPGPPVYVVPQSAMNELVGFNIHRGCLALARRPDVPALHADVLRKARCIVALDGVSNPDNVGGIFRSAAALGADLVALGPGCGDPLYRKAVRTAMGATLALPWARAEPWVEALARLERADFEIAALTPSPTARPLSAWTPDRRPVALVAGAEGSGLSADTLAAAHVHVTIPMTGPVDSLNVHTAVAIALYHVMVSRTS
jgi:tRNA G18 (ribose-2'-O)-methylase SpoU